MKKLLLAALATTLTLANPAAARTFTAVETLVKEVEKTGTTFTINTNNYDRECVGNRGYYAFKKDAYDVLVLCKDQVDVTDVHAVWEVLAHEATHVMQACTPGGDTAFRDEDHPAMIDDIKRIAPKDLDLIVEAYEKHEWKGELEAFWMMRQDPETVINYLRQICAR
jgi:hypothetical protein